MLSVKSNWELKAGRSSTKNEGSTGKLGTGKVQVFRLADEKYLELINLYPEFRRFIFLRANLRRTHWLSIFEENRN